MALNYNTNVRRIGSVINGSVATGNGGIQPFIQDSNNHRRNYFLFASENSFRFISSAGSTSPTRYSASAFIPPTAQALRMYALANNGVAFFMPQSNPEGFTTSELVIGIAGTAGTNNFDITCDGNQGVIIAVQTSSWYGSSWGYIEWL